MKKILTLVTIFAFIATANIACKRANRDMDADQEAIEIEETINTEDTGDDDLEDITDNNANPDAADTDAADELPADGGGDEE